MEEVLTPQQELFCRYYAQNNELFSNGTLSYAEAYDYKLDELSTEAPVLDTDDKGEPIKWGDSDYKKAYDVCSANASRLLRNEKIQARIVVLMNEWMKDEIVDSELFKVIKQNYKLESKIAAIREYNKLKQRITEKVDHTTKGEPINNSAEIAALTAKLNELHRTTGL